MPKVKDRNFWESAKYNSISFREYYDNFTEIAVSNFKWNLPETIDIRFLELCLFTDGKVIIFYDDVIGYVAMRCNPNGRFDIYNNPILRNAYANNGYHITLNPENSVIIYNNYLRKPTAPIAEYYAKRLWDIDRTIDVNIHAQKTPYIIACNEEDLLTLKNIYAKIDGNEQVIFAKRGLDLESIKVLKTDAPMIAPSLYDLRTKIYNEALEKLGIASVQNEKSQFLSIPEVVQSSGSVYSNRYSRLDARRMGCEELKSVFGIEASCDFKDNTRLDTAGLIDIGSSDEELDVEKEDELL